MCRWWKSRRHTTPTFFSAGVAASNSKCTNCFQVRRWNVWLLTNKYVNCFHSRKKMGFTKWLHSFCVYIFAIFKDCLRGTPEILHLLQLDLCRGTLDFHDFPICLRRSRWQLQSGCYYKSLWTSYDTLTVVEVTMISLCLCPWQRQEHKAVRVGGH